MQLRCFLEAAVMNSQMHSGHERTPKPNGCGLQCVYSQYLTVRQLVFKGLVARPRAAVLAVKIASASTNKHPPQPFLAAAPRPGSQQQGRIEGFSYPARFRRSKFRSQCQRKTPLEKCLPRGWLQSQFSRSWLKRCKILVSRRSPL